MSQTRSERNRWVSPQYVAEFFDVTDRTVINWIKRGDVRARRLAQELEEALGVLSTFDEGTDLVLYYKYLLELGGDSRYALHFNETDALSTAQRKYAENQYTLFRTWYADWSAAL